MEWIQFALFLSTLLCALVAGFVFAFAVVIMPGIKTLGDRDYLRAFKVMDGVIQNNPPLFIIVWLGSAVALVVSTALSFWSLAGVDLWLVSIACVIYIFGVQLPTIRINVPLNNQLQRHDLDAMTEPELRAARETFEPRWVRWNTIRTILSTVTTALLIGLLIRL